MHLLKSNVFSLISAGCIALGSRTVVYFDAVADTDIIGWNLKLVEYDTHIDNPYASHIIAWTVPLYTLTPIYKA